MKTMATPHARQGGFLMAEVLMALVLLSLVAGTLHLSMTERQIDILERDRIEQVAGEIYRLAQGAQQFWVLNRRWPSESRNCVWAYAVLLDEGWIKGVGRHTPFLDRNEQRIPYEFSCTARHFGIKVMAEDNGQARDLHGKLPGSVVNGEQVTAYYPRPGTAERYMALDGSTQPTEAWDMGGQYLYNLSNAATRTGQFLASSVQTVALADPGQRIEKPECPAGWHPHISTVLSQFETRPQSSIRSVRLPVADQGSHWVVQAVVNTSSGTQTLSTGQGKIAAFVKCSR